MHHANIDRLWWQRPSDGLSPAGSLPAHRDVVAPAEPFDVGGDELLDLLQVFLVGCVGAQYQRARGSLEGAPALAEADRSLSF
jgi:hypothetical protein